MDAPCFVYLFIHRWTLGLIPHLFYWNGAVNTVVQISVPVPTFKGFGYIIPEVKLLDHNVSLINCLSNYHTVFLNHTFLNSEFYGMWIISQFFKL